MTDMSAVHCALSDALAKRGYDTLTPVQTAVIAPEYEGRDMLVSARTGSGKTVAFGLAMADTLLGDDDAFRRADTPLALIIAPTRELAIQVKRELEWLYGPAGASIASCVGGMDMRDERSALRRGAHIVVGTPGRLRDHIDRKSLDLRDLKVAVLDEADEMLNMGFSEDLEYILSASPDERRTLMFSATVPPGIGKLAKKYQNNAERINTVSDTQQHSDITYRAVTTSNKDKQNAIINILRYYEAKTAIVFCGTRAAVNHLTARFNNRGFSVVALSGELSQSQRTHALQAMRDGRARVCIATDVAARGIDLPDLELVIHADLPKNAESLLHRSGRTGRAGRKGTCALIVPHKAKRKAERLLRDAKVTAEWANPPSADDVRRRDNERLLADPTFLEAPTEKELPLMNKLLEAFTPEQIATALVRMKQTDRTAPEELRDKGAPDDDGPRAKKREDFHDGVWFSLNVGRNDRAEPRWLLPMLFKNGDLERGEVGAIKITDNETFIEIDPKGVERFNKALGANMKLEKHTVKQLGEKPAAANRGGPHSSGSGARRDRDDSYGDKPKRDYSKSRAKPRYDRAPKRDDSGYNPDAGDFDTPRDPDPFMNDAPRKKKPHKKKLRKAAERAARAGNPNNFPPRKSDKTTGKKSGSGKPKGKTAGNKPKRASGGEAKLMRRKRK